ncbi:MAG: choline dehydrogenase, partial [Kiloniellales bacterium]|nr:choline dehydrogenase [Kiloniellales bacterium]
MQADRFDYIVIGGGSAGGFLLRRLSENPQNRVLLLEAGGSADHWTVKMPAATRMNFTGGPRNWCFETEPEPHMNNRRIFQPRGKVLGGSSSLNGMVYVRGNAKDFDAWEAAGACGWGYEDLLPYFKRVETYRPGANDYRGGEGPIVVERLRDLHPIESAFLKAAEEAGYHRSEDYNGAEQEGVTAFDVNIDRGYRSATASTCIAPAMGRSNVTVLTGAHVTRILVEKGTAFGVQFRHQGQIREVEAEAEIVLSAGAFQSPQILLLSGIGAADELAAHGVDCLSDLPGVGQNLQDHLEVHVKHRCPEGLSKNGLLRKDRMLLAGLQWFLFKSGPAATTPSRVGGFLKTDEAIDYPNLQYHFWPYYLEGWSPPADKDGYCFDVGTLRAESRGWIKLQSSDPFQSPRIHLNGLSREKDLVDFRRCIRMTREIADQPAFDFCRGPEVAPGPEVASDSEIDAYVRENANSAYHPCGTCKMGRDEMAVVDPELRVRGLEGLRVADASVMPSIT